MSLTIVLRAADGLVMAADSRRTEGYNLQGPKTRDDSMKFIKLSQDWGIMTYGLLEIGNLGISTLKHQIDFGSCSDVKIDRLCQQGPEIFSQISEDWSKNHLEIQRKNKDVGFILAGYKRDINVFSVLNFQSPNFNPISSANGCLMAGQWHVSKFLINRLYHDKLTIDEMRYLAAFLLHATMTVEKTVGGKIRLATITAEKGFQWVNEDDLKPILQVNARLSAFISSEINKSILNVLTGP